MDSRAGWQEIIPLLQVSDLDESLEYYQHVLGFGVNWQWPTDGPAKWAHVSRDNIAFMLTFDMGTAGKPFIAEKGNGVVFYVLVDDIDAAYNDLLSRGAIVAQEMVQYGSRRQFSIAELNGYVLAFSEPFSP